MPSQRICFSPEKVTCFQISLPRNRVREKNHTRQSSCSSYSCGSSKCKEEVMTNLSEPVLTAATTQERGVFPLPLQPQKWCGLESASFTYTCMPTIVENITIFWTSQASMINNKLTHSLRITNIMFSLRPTHNFQLYLTNTLYKRNPRINQGNRKDVPGKLWLIP